jgi:hypothetical protein
MAAMQGMTRAGRAGTTLIGAIAVMLALTGTASAAVFTPTTFVDEEVQAGDCPADAVESNPDADCSLREAIDAASTRAGADEVVLAAGRYELDPDKDTVRIRRLKGETEEGLLIRGAGARATTIDGNGTTENETRVLTFNSGSVSEVRDLAITGGAVTGSSNGGAIKVQDGPDATVTMTRVWIHGNTSENDGGAISNRGKLTLVQSLVSDNVADGSGGGIENDDELTLINTTISGNRALGDIPRVELSEQFEDEEGNGGGIDNDGDDSEVEMLPPTLAETETETASEAPFVRAENSTITGNQAAGNGGGISTAIQEAGAVAPQGAPRAGAYFHNSIVSDNTADAEANCSGNYPLGSGAQSSSEGNNIEDGETCQFTAPGDQDNTPKLGPLADNGGGTDTHALLEGSLAIDTAAAEGCPATDQRGIARPQRTACDVGAFELEAAPVTAPPLVDPPAQEQPAPPPQGQPECTDTTDPLTTLRNSGLRIGTRSVKLSGSSRDPGACTTGIQRVEVSMAKVSGTGLNCRFIRSSNRFVISPFANCRQPILFVADGMTKWKFTFRGRIEPGKYRAQARAYDVARNKETPKKGRNIIYFEVK